jgi:hypothetical protein
MTTGTSCTGNGTVPVEGGGIHPVEENLQKLFICHHLLQQTRVIAHRFYFYYPLGWYRYRYIFKSVADPGCLSRIRLFSIPDSGSEFFHPGSRIRIKEFKYFNPQKWFLSSRKCDPGCSSRSGSRIRILTFYPSRIQGSRVKKVPNPESGSATLIFNIPNTRY